MQQYLLFIVRVSYFQVDINVLTPSYSIGSSYTLHNNKLTNSLERNKVLDIQINECTFEWCRVTLIPLLESPLPGIPASIIVIHIIILIISYDG